MRDTIRYYDRNNVLRLTLNEYPYYSEPSDLKDWIWGFNEQFGVINTFYRNKTEYELVIGIAGDYLPHHDALCDIFSADVIANEPGYLELRGWRLPCYIVEASYEYGLSLDRQAKFRVRSVNSTWIRTNTRSYNGVPGGGLGGEDLGRDYIFSYVPPEKYEDTGEIIKIENDEEDLTLTSLSVSLSPIQDLNGYDAPWVGGAGVNVFPYLNTREATFSGVTFKSDGKGTLQMTGTATGDNYASLTFSEPFVIPDGTTYKFCMLNTESRQDSVFRFMNESTIVDSWSPTPVNREATYSGMSGKTVTGIRLYCKNGETYNLTMQPMFVPKTETVTGYIPYENICPISGRTSVETTRTGKNLLASYATPQTKNGIAFTIDDDGTITANGTATATTVLYLSAYVDTWSSGSFILSGCPSSGGDRKYCLRMFATGGTTLVSDFGSGVTFTGQSQLECAIVIWNGQTVSNAVFKPMIRLATDTDATYEPYNGQTYTTALGRIVYGGTLDVVSGELVVTDGYISSYNGETLPSTWVSDRDVYASGTTPTAGAQVAYKLATPQTYQLTPQQVSLLVGENNLWTNTGGTIDVKYETISVSFPARGYNYGYSQPESHAAVINLPGTGNGYEIIVYGPQTNPVIYLNNQPVQVNVELSAQQRLRIVSNGSVKTIEILSSSGQATDAFVYRDKENTPFLTLGTHTDLTFGQIRFDFTTIERRSEPTWT